MNDNENKDQVYGDKRIYWLWLVLVCGIGSNALHNFREKYPSVRSCVEAIMDGTETELTEAAAKKAAKLTLDDAKQLIEKCESQGVSVIYMNDEEYPQRLRAVPDAPPVIFVKGDLLSLNSQYTAVIAGARDPDGYSLAAVDLICEQLAQRGVTVVTGLEKGIDITAARSAVSHGAVHAGISGRGIFCEKEAEDLFGMCGGGEVMIGEFTSVKDFGPVKFAERNRILCGLADAVIFVQCAADSKGLKIAQTARSLGRAVLAVPPTDITDPRYFGQRDLIRTGAAPYFDADDFFNSIKNNGINENSVQNAVQEQTYKPVSKPAAAKSVSKPAAKPKTPAAKPKTAVPQTAVQQTAEPQTAEPQTVTHTAEPQTAVQQKAGAAYVSVPMKTPIIQNPSSVNGFIRPEVEAVREDVKRTLKGAVEELKEREQEKAKDKPKKEKKESPQAKKKREERERLAAKYEELDDDSKAMYQMIKSEGSMRLYQICDRTGLNSPEVSMPLMKLKIAGLIKDTFGAYTAVEF